MKDTNNKQSASTLLISVKLKDDEQDYGQRVRSTITIETNKQQRPRRGHGEKKGFSKRKVPTNQTKQQIITCTFVIDTTRKSQRQCSRAGALDARTVDIPITYDVVYGK